MSHSSVLAAVYAHNPLTRPNGFFTYWRDTDGMLYHDEYFENQLEEIYSGKTGYIYECEGKFMTMEKMPWVYLSEQPVSVRTCTKFPIFTSNCSSMNKTAC